MPSKTKASEELLAAPLPELIRDLGIAVAKANQEMANSTDQGPNLVYSIPSAEIEINVAISIEKSDDLSVGGGLNLHAFSVNASYKSTYGFKEEASSRIKLVLQAKPLQVEPPKADSVQVEPSKVETVQEETSKADASKTKTSKTESSGK